MTSPYFKTSLTASPDISRMPDDSPVKQCLDVLEEDGFPPYNSYWGALARAARAKPKLIQGNPGRVCSVSFSVDSDARGSSPRLVESPRRCHVT